MKGFSDSLKTAVLLIISFGIAASFYMMVNSTDAAKPITVEQITAYCVNDTAYLVIRNGGSAPLTRASFVCTKTDFGCSGECVADDNFPSGGAGYVKVYGCSSGTHQFTLTGASNSLQLAVYCK